MNLLIAPSCWLPAVLIACSLASAEPGPVVINEIMYHPPRDLEQLQYIELFNAGKSERDLSGWSFSKGVKFVFPAKTKLEAGGYLVVCRDRVALLNRYRAQVPVVGEFAGHLSHGGERLELSDQDGNVMDKVKYADSTPWPMAADGHSASLERICPFAPGDDPSNWSASKLPEIETPAGTPGRRNDSFASNPPPVISDVKLTPTAPLPEQPVAVEASVADAGGVENVELVFAGRGAGSAFRAGDVADEACVPAMSGVAVIR
jgi:hypothetical protein